MREEYLTTENVNGVSHQPLVTDTMRPKTPNLLVFIGENRPTCPIVQVDSLNKTVKFK
jgi:hypothetical protein